MSLSHAFETIPKSSLWNFTSLHVPLPVYHFNYHPLYCSDIALLQCCHKLRSEYRQNAEKSQQIIES